MKVLNLAKLRNLGFFDWAIPPSSSSKLSVYSLFSILLLLELSILGKMKVLNSAKCAIMSGIYYIYTYCEYDHRCHACFPGKIFGLLVGPLTPQNFHQVLFREISTVNIQNNSFII